MSHTHEVELQAKIDKAFSELNYVDTGDLIDALTMAVRILKSHGIVVSIPNHDDAHLASDEALERLRRILTTPSSA